MSDVVKATSLVLQIPQSVMWLPVLWWSHPGEGKTKTVHAVGQAMGLQPVVTLVGSYREPSDINGIPIVVDGMVVLAPPKFARELVEAGRGILFLEELSTSPPSVQAPCLRACNEGSLGDTQLPPEVRVLAAANPPETAAGGWDLSPPLANRFYHLDFALKSDEFIQGMTVGWKVESRLATLDQKAYEAQLPQSKALVASYIYHRPTALRENPIASKAWASARTWDMAAMAHAACFVAFHGAERDDTTAMLMAGAVGPGRAGEFLEWQRSLDLPDPDAVLKHPESFKIPERGDRLFAALNSVVSLAVQRIDENEDAKRNWIAAWKVLHRVATNDHKDVATAVGRGLAQRRAKMDIEDVLHLMAPFATLMKKVGLV